MNNDQNNGKENRGYQPQGGKGTFGYQPKQSNGAANGNTINGSNNKGASLVPPSGTKGEDG